MLSHTSYSEMHCWVGFLLRNRVRFLLTTPAELQHTQPQIYEGLTKGLNPDEQNIIKGVVHEAEAKKLAADATAAALGIPVNGR